jgi:hypothetical protein
MVESYPLEQSFYSAKQLRNSVVELIQKTCTKVHSSISQRTSRCAEGNRRLHRVSVY